MATGVSQARWCSSLGSRTKFFSIGRAAGQQGALHVPLGVSSLVLTASNLQWLMSTRRIRGRTAY